MYVVNEARYVIGQFRPVRLGPMWHAADFLMRIFPGEKNGASEAIP